MGKAIDYMNEIGLDQIHAHEEKLIAHFLEKAEKFEGLLLMGPKENRASVFSFTLDGVHPLDAGTLLNEFGIAVRTGQHCCQPIMDRYGIHASIRASLAFYNTTEEIDFFFEKLSKVKTMLV